LLSQVSVGEVGEISQNFHLRATTEKRFAPSLERMKTDNSVLASAQAARGGVSASNGKPGNKILTVSLESASLGRAVVLRCQGPVIFRSEAQGLSGMICDVLPQARRTVVDLAGVHSLDSGALGELVLTQMWSEAAGYELKFSSPTDSVRQLFETTNLVSIFDVYSTVEGALAAMHPREERHS
jgi:anti-anti-sigma factor